MRWMRKLGRFDGDSPTGDRVESSPAIAEGVVYFGSFDHSLYAASASTGELLWQYATEGPVSSSPMVAGGVVYVGSTDGSLYAIRLPESK